jgi:hypothetical protein
LHNAKEKESGFDMIDYDCCGVWNVTSGMIGD